MNKSSRPVVDLTARCACGLVSLRVAGAIRSMFHCSCEDCQRATGAGHSTVAVAGSDDVTVTGEVTSFDRPANSGAVLTRFFCPVCGTPICGWSSRAPGLTMLPVGLFGGGADWFGATQLIFARSRRDWDHMDVMLPQFSTYPNDS